MTERFLISQKSDIRNSFSGTCDSHIGMGVRYNAEKKKIGSYYSTPIFSFRCKCHLCSGWFEIQTDPKVCYALAFTYFCFCLTYIVEYALYRDIWCATKG